MQIDAADRLIDFRAKVAGGHDSSSFARSVYRRLRHRSAEVNRHSPRDLDPLELEHVGGNSSLIQLVDPLSVEGDETAHASSR